MPLTTNFYQKPMKPELQHLGGKNPSAHNSVSSENILQEWMWNKYILYLLYPLVKTFYLLFLKVG